MKKIACLLFFLTLGGAFAQTDDFNDGNDNGWTRFQPLSPFGVTSYTFTAGGYRLACNPSPNPGAFGPARMSALRPGSVYTEFAVCVDFTGWDVAQDTSMGIMARLQPDQSPGNIAGYALTYQGNDQDIEINRVTSEAGTKISQGVVSIPLDPAKAYRMVFFGIGGYLEGRIFDRVNPLVPLATVTAFDTTYASGSNGLLIFTELNTAIAATFDNYRADAGAAPPLLVNRAPAGGLVLSWNTELGLPWRFESSNQLLNWAPQPPDLLETGMTQWHLPALDVSLSSARFFRLAKGLPAP